LNYRVVSATVVAAAIAAFALVLTGPSLLSIPADLLPIPRITSASPEVVVVDTSGRRPPAAGSRTNPTPVDDPSSTGDAILASGASASVAVVPVPSSTPVEVPVFGSTRSGYVRDGHVTLSLGWTRHAGVTTTVERRLAALSQGTCGIFGPWEPASATDQLPPGSCAVYRVLVDGTVVYQLPEIVRYDGTRPIIEEIGVTETGAREHVAGSTVYIAAGADDLRPLSVSALASDPESGLANVVFSSGETSVTVSTAPWQAELVPARGGISVTAVNPPGDEATSAVDVVVDGDGPNGGFVDYPAEPGPDGTVRVTFDAGNDAGSGIDAAVTELERRAAVLTSDGCGEYGGWRPSSANDTAPEGRCLQYRYRVQDNVGNETIYTSSVELTAADRTGPTTAIVSPAEGAIVSGTVEVVAEADDNGSGLRSLAIQLRGPAGGWTSLGSGSNANLTAAWDTLTVEPGRYVLRSVAEDRSGNVTESEWIEVTVAADTTAPRASIVSPADGSTVSGSTEVEAEAMDDESGLRSVTLQVRRPCGGWSDLATFSSGPFAATWDTSVLEPGRYQLRAVATDRRGNTSISAAVTVTVESIHEEPPTPEPPGDHDSDDEDSDDEDEDSDGDDSEDDSDDDDAGDEDSEDEDSGDDSTEEASAEAVASAGDSGAAQVSEQSAPAADDSADSE
jgi:hypothetical protein